MERKHAGGFVQINEPTDLLAARVELMVLRSTLPDSIEDRSRLYILSPDGTRMNASEVAETLARLSKPCVCSAERVASDTHPVVYVRCKAVETTEEVAVHRHQMLTGEEILKQATSSSQGRPVTILVCYGSESVAVDQDVLVAWSHDYATRGTHAFLHQRPKEGLFPGISYLVHLSGVSEPGDSSFEDVPEELLRQLPPSLRRRIQEGSS